ncbi:unnamed protein product [Somion occarium]|uniref:F-box domain-containing protein n=1 Tax=Somion occarium TaxID=3059160 RepID=A0ABP1E6U5_9APHY
MKALPQELVDIIIDFLHNDKSTLKSCSEVSRTWVDSASLHLFARVSPLWRPPYTDSLATFAVKLKSSLRLQRYVKCLEIKYYKPQYNGVQAPNPIAKKPPIPLETLFLALQNFPHLERLICGDIELFSISGGQSAMTELRQLPTVRLLGTKFSVVGSTSSIGNFFGRFRSVETLFLSNIKFDPRDTSLFLPSTTKVQAPTVVATSPNVADLFIILRNTVHLPSVVSCGLSIFTLDDIPIVGAFLEAHLRRIIVLELNLLNFSEWSEDGTQPSWHRLELPKLSQVNALILNTSFTSGTLDQNDFGWLAIPSIVFTLPSTSSLSSIRIHVLLSDLGPRGLSSLQRFIWSEFNSALARLRGLKEVIFALHVLVSKNRVSSWAAVVLLLQSALQDVQERGILQVELCWCSSSGVSQGFSPWLLRNA